MIPKRLSEKLSHHARNVFGKAEDIARSAGAAAIAPKHLLLAILGEDGSFGNIFFGNTDLKKEFLDGSAPFVTDGGRKTAVPKVRIGQDGKKGTRRKEAVPLAPETKTVLAQAYFIASDFRSPYVGTEHLAYSLIENPDRELETVFSLADINRDKTLDALESHLEPDRIPSFGRMLDLPDLSLARPDEGDGNDIPFLSQYAVDLGRESEHRGEAFFGRETEIDRVIRILGRKEKNNPLLLGDPGVGKTAIVSALARRLRSGDVPASLLGKRILALDLALVVAGTSFRGEFEARLRDIVAEAKEHPEILLFIDELHTIVGTGNAQGGLDVANILKPALARGEIRVIGATTAAEYKKHIEKDPALARRFQAVGVREPSEEETRTLLRHVRSSYERFHGISIGNDLVNLAVSLSVRHIHDRFLPDKAIDILDEASSLAKGRRETDHAGRAAAAIENALRNLGNEKKSLIHDGRFDEAAALLDDEARLRKEKETLDRRSIGNGKKTARIGLTRRDILETVSSVTGIPFSSLDRESPAERLSRLGEALRKSVAHQEEAVSAVESSLARALGGVRDPEKPLGSFLFLGPTGVGKTLLAKSVAKHFFGGEDRLIRLDMSEFMERHNVARIIGAPAGYVGFGEGGKLTERIRRTPHAVVLFDEIEKAHPDVWNILLQILDEGTLTDAEGTRVSFRDALIILTSNLGTESLSKGGRIGFSGGNAGGKIPDAVRENILREMKRTLRPELLARIGHSVVFDPLGEAAMERVVRLELETLKTRLRKRGVSLSAPAPVVGLLSKRSLSPEHGARLVRGNIEELVSLPLARTLIGKGFDPESPKGRLRVILSVKDDTIVCNIA